MEKRCNLFSIRPKNLSRKFLTFVMASCLLLSLPSCSDDDEESGPTGPAATDLGEGANCYIVSEAGDYYFKPLHVSGKPIENVAKVDWIWTTLNEQGQNPEAITNLRVDELGNIAFTASGDKGNTIIAGLDTDDNIVWTWHIWCTDTPEVITYETGAEFMDRNLGANEAGYSGQAMGLLFQWGRKDPFFGSRTDGEGSGESFARANEATVMNPKMGFAWKAEAHAVTIEEAGSNPTTFFFDNQSLFNWMSEDNQELWGVEKTDYDPSPAGWRLASKDDWACLNDDNLLLDKEKKAYSYTYNGVTTWWPCNGLRDDANGGGEMVKPTDKIHVWACGVYKMEDLLGNISYFGDRMVADPYMPINTSCPGWKLFAQPVRCVKIK